MSEVFAALYKKALGYTAEEEVREYGSEDELIKRKVTVKNVPPDTAAAKAYLEIDPARKRYEAMSASELKKEAARLYKEIKEIKADGCKEN